MKKIRAGKVTNYGVLNVGTIYGDVVQTVNGAFAASGRDDEPEFAELRERLIGLAELIESNASRIEDAEQTLKRVRSIAEEVTSQTPDRSIIDRYLELLGSTLAKLPPVFETVTVIKDLVGKLFGGA